MLLYVRHGTDGRLGSPTLETVVFPVGSDLIQHAEIRGKQQRTVVQQSSLYQPLRAARDF